MLGFFKKKFLTLKELEKKIERNVHNPDAKDVQEYIQRTNEQYYSYSEPCDNTAWFQYWEGVKDSYKKLCNLFDEISLFSDSERMKEFESKVYVLFDERILQEGKKSGFITGENIHTHKNVCEMYAKILRRIANYYKKYKFYDCAIPIYEKIKDLGFYGIQDGKNILVCKKHIKNESSNLLS